MSIRPGSTGGGGGGGGGGGAAPLTYRTATAAATAVAEEYLGVDATAGVVAVTLPAGPVTGTRVGVKKLDATTNVVNILTPGSELIDGHADAQIVSQFAGGTFLYDGANWLLHSPTHEGGLSDTGDTAAWSTYTPVITAATTNPTINAAAVHLGGYQIVGKTVHFRMDLAMSNASTNGTGEYRLSLPPGCVGTGSRQPVRIQAFHTGVAHYRGSGLVKPGEAFVSSILLTDSTGSPWNGSTPMGVNVAGAIVYVSGTVEIA